VDTVEIHRLTVYRLLIRPLVFRLDPERAHDLTLWILKQAARVPFLLRLMAACRPLAHPLLRTEVCGLRFPNPVGLAAGFDKSATAVAAFPAEASICDIAIAAPAPAFMMIRRSRLDDPAQPT